ncbi:membrane protein insertase YidC [Persephonella sp.]
MNHNEQEMQKRIFIFFVVVAVLLIGYSVINSYLYPPEPATEKKTQVQETKTTEQSNPEVSETGDTQSQTTTLENVTYKQSGDYDLILNQRRINADNLKNLVKINTNFGYIEISKVGARIVSIYVEKFKTDMISDFSKRNRLFPTEIITTSPELTALISFSPYSFRQENNKLIFELNKGNIKVRKVFVVNENSTLSLKIETTGLEKYELAIINGVSLKAESQGFGHSGAIIKTDEELIKLDADIERKQIIRGNILWAGEENKYFFQMFAVKDGFSATHVVPVAKEKTVVFSEIPASVEGFFFGGPKLYSLLGEITDEYKEKWNVDLALTDSIDFGIFGILGKPLFLIMHFIYDYIHNWGLTIIILTILLRIVLFPLNHKSLKAMKKMADLAPEIKKLQKKYAKDPQKLQEEMMKLYAEHGTNPMSGCLPIIAQIPIFIALYNVLMVTVELKMVPFLWVQDLANKDPYYILPILMGVSMIAQQWIMPSSDKNQKIIMYIMAFVFTFLFMNFPAGLVLYWLTNNILGIFQSFIVNKQMGLYKPKNNG